MKFEQVLQDIAALRGVLLHSIKAGAEITIVEVTEERIKVQRPNGEIKSRPLNELQRVWEALCSHPAVHVDSLLGGSGSSRNQPETLFANLPYVEYLYVKGKKHLTLGPPSHQPGTLKEAALSRKIQIEESLKEKAKAQPEPAVFVLTCDIAKAASELEGLTGVKPAITDVPGEYLFQSGGTVILLKTINEKGLAPKEGTYVLLKNRLQDHGGSRIYINGTSYLATTKHGLNFLVEEV